MWKLSCVLAIVSAAVTKQSKIPPLSSHVLAAVNYEVGCEDNPLLPGSPIVSCSFLSSNIGYTLTEEQACAMEDAGACCVCGGGSPIKIFD